MAWKVNLSSSSIQHTSVPEHIGPMKQAAVQYVSSFQVERFYRSVRYHWLICRDGKPDEMVAWGHASTQELAETAARKTIEDLSSCSGEADRWRRIHEPVIHRRGSRL
jgi:hypothetical protein